MSETTQVYPPEMQPYHDAIQLLKPYVRKGADNHFYYAEGADALGIDPIVFNDLKRSMDETNRMIDSGEIDHNEVVWP